MLNQTLRRIGASPPTGPTPAIIPSRFFSSRTQGNPLSYRPNAMSRPQFSPRYLHPTQSRPYTLFSRFRDNFNEARKHVWRERPIGMTATLLFAVSMTSGLIYLLYDHITRVEPQFSRFPKPVGDSLRKAIYYTEFELNPVRALHWYKQALIAADQLGMHPFSEEVLGIRLQIPHMLEKAGMMKPAIEVLEKTQKDCLEWVQNGRRKQMIRNRERARDGNRIDDPTGTGEERKAEQEKEAEEERRRGFVMKRAAGVGVKIAELYSSDYVRETDKAEKALLSAVDLSRAELQHRREMNLPVSQGDGDYYLNLTEVAFAFNELADFYAERGRSDLSTALYMQSLSLIKEDQQDRPSTCAQVVLLNNISSQMAEQAQNPTPPPAETTSGTHMPPVSRDQLLNAASEWAKKALDVADKIQPPVRTEECDQGCLTATYNLGEIAEMQGHFSEAKKYYGEAREIAKKIQSPEGVSRANEGLERLKKQA
ncbi:TPR domain-containing protein [Coccidioides immitis RS]|uniref:TPR domain-containing protein n=1 Tax=Coccidioides immitis (strain RS) TaxID=246410 RepID=J3K1M7_COCIM|nr:TPR domain-containing protein [Coccidioides immitis RS]EAS27906.3 TPR domain-containing protein [Coccidioides immitis RS]TPX20585.1 hypothetical protein DIZ76_016477 [Coccidioides immitis]